MLTPRSSADVLFTFDNRTDEALCEYGSDGDVSGRRCLAGIKPNGKTKWGRDCDGLNDRPITMIIVVRSSGQEIYNRTATCGEWTGDSKIIIEQRGQEFIVTDSLPDG